MAANLMTHFKQFCCRSPARVFVTVFLVLLIIGSWFLTHPTPKSELFVSFDSKKPQVLKNGPHPRVQFESSSHRKKTNFNNLHMTDSVAITRNKPANIVQKNEFRTENSKKVTENLHEPNEKHSDDEATNVAKDTKQNENSHNNLNLNHAQSKNTMGGEKDEGEKKSENKHYIEVDDIQENLKVTSEEGEAGFSKKHGSETEGGSEIGRQKLENKRKLPKSRTNQVELDSNKNSDENRNINEMRPQKFSIVEKTTLNVKSQGESLMQNKIRAKNRKEQHFSQMESSSNENSVLIPFVKAAENSQLTEQFKTCVASICEHTSVNLSFHIVADKDSWVVAKEIFDHLVTTCQQHFDVKYHNVQRIAEKLKSVTEMLRELFSAGKKSYYHNPVFFLTAAIHLALPATMEKVIVLDSDLKFQSDIKGLFDMFSKFAPANIMGFAYEQQPTYRHSLYQYRELHKSTKIGNPPPDGVPGFNSGVALLNLQNMRKAHIYNQLLSGTVVKEMAEKYHFKGNLGDQDLFTLLGFDYHELFYIIPCSWNRQLCRFWERGYENVFDSYHKCPGPIHVYHGNCKTPISSQYIDA